ncbi:hypothetical protein ACIRVF_11195 [Kitasatospora sp. NPDC101157]|uniref:hypothetical protein n=1 Tax=Kitasatospora sp. NPDC101157 TaxID=3364098 RepID=UPI00382B16C8
MGKFSGSGYVIQPEIVSALLANNPSISEKEIEENGGGLVVVVLKIHDRRRINLRQLARDLIRMAGTGIELAVISAPLSGGPTWSIVKLDQLRELAQGLYDMKQQLRLEQTLRARA